MSKAIQTVTQLAAAVNRNKSSVSRWINRPDWPFGRAPWPSSIVSKVQAWRAEHLQERTGNDPEADRQIWQWMAAKWPEHFGPEAMEAMERQLEALELETPNPLANASDEDIQLMLDLGMI